MKRNAGLILITALLVLAWTVALAQDAAMVVDLKGEPAVYESGTKAGQEVLLMDFLAKDDKIDIKEGTTLVLNYFASGAREEIEGPGTITVGAESSAKAGEARIQTAKVDYIPPAVGGKGREEALHAGTVALRGFTDTSPELQPLEPTDTVVRSLPLTFKWRAVPGATGYRFALLDVKGEALDSAEVKSPEYASDVTKLNAGSEYSWSVEALEEEEVIAEGGGKFLMMDAETRIQVGLTEQYIRKNYPDESTEGLIALAMLYKKYQLNDEAKNILTNLSRQHPRNANIVRHINELKMNYSPQS
jgi:hypothetical protein